MGIEQPAIQLYSETVAGISLVFMLFCQTCLDPIDVPSWHAKEKTREEKMVFLLTFDVIRQSKQFSKNGSATDFQWKYRSPDAWAEVTSRHTYCCPPP